MDSSEFSRYILDCMKYSVNIDVVHEQLNYLRKVNDGMQLTPSQLDEKIAENNVRVAKVTTELTEKQIELLKLKNELRALQFAEAQSKCAKTVHDDAIGSTHNEQIRDSAMELTHAAQMLQIRLGFTLKLTKCDETNPNFWLATFLFDANAVESSKYVVFRVDVTGGNFRLVDMKPMPPRFREMQQFLVSTNDVTGLLTSCSKYFNSR